MSVDVEARLARNTVRRSVIVGPALVAVFWAARGAGGAWAAMLGVALVVGNFLLSGAMLSLAARISLSLYHAAALFGFFLRLGLITLTLLIVIRLWPGLDRLALGITVVIAYLALLSWEALAVAKGAERDLEWIS